MCGIIGEVLYTPRETNFAARQTSLSHRGPDVSAYREFEKGKVRFGHQRLSIIDVSERGNQPMIVDGYAIIYNGEVYNFRELQKIIEGPFASSSDTEVLLRGYIQYGIEIFEKLNGMFAIAIYDPNKKQVICARDRFGVKPFYYYQTHDTFSFASEMKALPHRGTLHADAVGRFLSQGYIAGNAKILAGVYALPMGAVGTLQIDSLSFTTQSFFKETRTLKHSRYPAAVEETEQVLSSAVERAFISDVPVGVFLSSGIDSPLIAAIARKKMGLVQTFTVGFEDERFDESKRAEEIAKALNTRHHTLVIPKREVIDAMPDIFDAVGEPLGDSSIIPTYFLSRFAREQVKVCLAGDGADELFGGYPLYYLPRFARLFRSVPGNAIAASVLRTLPLSYGKMSVDFKIKQFVQGAFYDDPLEAHVAYRSLRRLSILPPSTTLHNVEQHSSWPLAEQLMYVDRKTVLPEQYLVKTDRLSMAHSLEVRVPFLDNEVLELANTMPTEYKIRGRTTKRVLRSVLANHLDRSLISHAKMGFSFPISAWLRTELKDYMLSALTRDAVAQVPNLEYTAVHDMMYDHLQGKDDCGRELWALLSLVHFTERLKNRTYNAT